MNEDNDMRVVVVGANGGIGRALVSEILKRDSVSHVYATYRTAPAPIEDPRVSWHHVDVTQASSVEQFCAQLGQVDWCVLATGFLHTDNKGPEKSLRQFEPEFFIDNIHRNTLPAMLFAKHLQHAFKHRRPAVFAAISAKVGSIEDNHLGGWYSYRSSKAALNMLLKTLAIEWKRSLPNVAVLSLHPGTTDTALSKPFQKGVPEGWLFTPAYSAECLVRQIEKAEPKKSGRFVAFDGEELPW